MSHGAGRKVDHLYRQLTPLERARLMARLWRENNQGEMARLRDSVSREQAETYNRSVRILCRLLDPGALLAELLLRSAERDVALLLHFLTLRYEQQSRRYALLLFWELLGYPITGSEYRALIKAERQCLETLDDFARYIGDTFSIDDAGEVCSAVANWLKEVPEDTGDDEALRQVRALLNNAVEAGQLPQPKSTPKAPALPWGTLCDWLHQSDGSAYEPYPPDYHIPALELLGALMPRWDVRPDSEAEAVHARREEIVNALASVAGLPWKTRLHPHPHKNAAQRQRDAKKMEAMNPWLSDNKTLEAVQTLGRRHGELRNHLQVLREVLETIQREDFGGEDLLLPKVRSLLDKAQEEIEGFAEWWKRAGEAFGMIASGGKWPELSDFQGEDEEALRSMYRSLLRQGDD